MTKLVLASVVLLGLTACDERVGRGIQAPTPVPLSMQVTQQHTEDEMPVLVQHEEVSMVNDIPILEDELPTLPTPTDITEPIATEKGMHQSKTVSTFTKTTIGSNIANIRISNSQERTRLVFDSYAAGAKASVSGEYSYNYDAYKKSIILTLKNYAGISALGSSKTRTYSASSRVKKIYLQNTKNTKVIKCVITLRKDANINVFDIKEPGRIVIDITPR